jgi:hypothetical protein
MDFEYFKVRECLRAVEQRLTGQPLTKTVGSKGRRTGNPIRAFGAHAGRHQSVWLGVGMDISFRLGRMSPGTERHCARAIVRHAIRNHLESTAGCLERKFEFSPQQ